MAEWLNAVAGPIGARARAVKSSVARGTMRDMLSIFVAIIFAALAYFLVVALGLPHIIAIIAAVLVLLAAIGGVGDRFHRL